MAQCLQCSIQITGAKYCSIACQQTFQRLKKLEEGTLRPKSIRHYLLNLRGARCECCGITEWQGKPVAFEMDHTDGDHENNQLTNLKLLCPNCHSQTPTYRARNKGNGRAYRRRAPE